MTGQGLGVGWGLVRLPKSSANGEVPVSVDREEIKGAVDTAESADTRLSLPQGPSPSLGRVTGHRLGVGKEKTLYERVTSVGRPYTFPMYAHYGSVGAIPKENLPTLAIRCSMFP